MRESIEFVPVMNLKPTYLGSGLAVVFAEDTGDIPSVDPPNCGCVGLDMTSNAETFHSRLGELVSRV